jgi:uncharacterized protein (TIGR02058 family)
MAKTRIALELGMGTSLRRHDYTKAACRAVADALWHNSLNLAEAFGFEKSDMIIDVEIGVQRPQEVDVDAVKAIFPYGSATIKVAEGGLDIDKPDGQGRTIVANAAVIVYFDMEPAAGALK